MGKGRIFQTCGPSPVVYFCMNTVFKRIVLLSLMAAWAPALACQFADSHEQGNDPDSFLPGPFPGQGSVTGQVSLPSDSSPENTLITLDISEIPDSVGVETIAEGLEIPWDLAFTPDGRILITERPGRVRVVADGELMAEPYATIDVAHVSEAGLMGIALHPGFSNNGHLFICYTYRDASDGLFNRIARLTDRDNRGIDHQTILDGIPGASRHDGCRIRFGPDGYLYATTGDATEPALAQDLDSLAGKVLRVAADGSVPPDNPLPDSYIYTYGHRNPQGLDWNPLTGELFITEHGPSQDDEVNLLEPGKNYGWPMVTGTSGSAEYSAQYMAPVLALTPTIAIAGAAFYSEGMLPSSWNGSLFFTALKGSHLQRVTLEPPEYREVLTREILYKGEFGRLRAVSMSPDGHLYLTTSNRDGRGSPRSEDDRLLRLVPSLPRHLTQLQEPAGEPFRLELPPGDYLLRLQAPGLAYEERRVTVVADVTVDLGLVEMGEEVR